MRMRAVPLLLVTALAAGCGGSGGGGSTTNREPAKPARRVLADAVRVATHASSLHVSGQVDSDKTPVALDLTLARGKGAKGTVTESGLSFDLVRIGGTVYIQGSSAFWHHYAASAAGLLNGRWIAIPSTNRLVVELAPLTSASKLFALVESSHGHLVNLGLTTYAGQKTAEIRDTSDGSKLYVAATGTPYPVALVGGRRHPDDQLRFDGWNAQVSLRAPQPAIDLSQLSLG